MEVTLAVATSPLPTSPSSSRCHQRMRPGKTRLSPAAVGLLVPSRPETAHAIPSVLWVWCDCGVQWLGGSLQRLSGGLRDGSLHPRGSAVFGPRSLGDKGVDGTGCRSACHFNEGGARWLHQDPIREFGKAQLPVKTEPQPWSWRTMAASLGVVTVQRHCHRWSYRFARAAHRETLDLDLQDMTMVAWSMSLPLLGSRFGPPTDGGCKWLSDVHLPH
jgi:hypothetical protein